MKQGLIVTVSGAALAVAAVASVFWMPERWQAVFYIQSSGANEVHIPVGYWLAALAWTLTLASALKIRVRAIAARAVLIAFATHVLVLLAAFAPLLRDAELFTSAIYQIYARVFGAAVLAGGLAWSVRGIHRWRDATQMMAVPIALASGVLSVALFRDQPALAILAIAAGLVAGWQSRPGADRAGAIAARLGRALSDDRVFVLAIFAVALMLRVLYLQRIMSNPGFVETGADGPVYDELAWSIAQGKGIRESFLDRFPLLLLGYVRFVGAIYWVAGHSYFAVGFVQAVIGSVTCVVFYDVARQLCGVKVARTAAWFTAISFPLLFAAAAIGHQAIDVFLTMAIVWWLLRGGPPASWPWWRWCTAGALFGVAIAVRETVSFFLAFVLLWIPFLFPRPWSRQALTAAGLVVVTALLAISPLVLTKISSAEERNKLRHHFDILYRGEADVVRMRDDIVAPLSDPGGALTQLRESPRLVIATLGRAWLNNFAMQFFAQPYGGFDLVFLRKGTAYSFALWFYAYALTLAGLIILLRRLRTDVNAAGIVLVLGLIGSRTLPHLVLESNYRHRVPIEPFLILLASVAVVQLIGSARRGGRVI